MERESGRKERRRRRTARKMEVNEFENSMETLEFSIHPHAAQSSRKLIRRDTYTVLKSRSDLDVAAAEDFYEDLQAISGEGNDSPESKNLTYSLDDSRHETYNLDKPEDPGGNRPIPAPRKRKKVQEKVSSDTDKDVTEIDLDDTRLRSDTESKKSQNSTSSREDLVVAPVPKPRKLRNSAPEIKSNSPKLDEELPKFPQSPDSNDKDRKSEPEKPPPESKELPLISSLQKESKQKTKKEKLSIKDLLERKRGKTRLIMKLEKSKKPKPGSTLKDVKEEDERKPEIQLDDDKVDFQIESPRYPESAQNGTIYVQSKNGFYLMERDEVLRNGNGRPGSSENGGRMEDSTVKTAVLFQKYWSRSMIYFHGILAGFALSHAATVTAIILHFDYEPQGFLAVYSCLSLKIHFIFYTLIALSIVSCFDRIDIGHINRKHWQTAWRIPSMWVILLVYLVSFGLTFSNQRTEARFDVYLAGNQTEEEIWGTQLQGDIKMSLLGWFHTVWARDMAVLLAWLLISLTEFPDLLYGHLNNMAKYSEGNAEDRKLRRVSRQTNFP